MTDLRSFFLIGVLDDSVIVSNSLKDTFLHIYLLSLATIQRIETDSVFLYVYICLASYLLYKE